jgi:flagellar hook-basal body complex protein FliE
MRAEAVIKIDEVIKLRVLDLRKAALKKVIRQAAGAARNVKNGLQRRMNAASDHLNQDQNKSPAVTNEMNAGEAENLTTTGLETLTTTIDSAYSVRETF